MGRLHQEWTDGAGRSDASQQTILFFHSLPGMTVNTSINFHLHSNMSCIQNIDFFFCLTSKDRVIVYGTFVSTVAILFIPICLLIFYLGLQKWRRLRSLNYTDFLNINFATIKLIVFLGHSVFFCGIYLKCCNMVNVGYSFWSISWHGENFFHFLTCTDRYLAVVHPIIFMELQSQRWKRIRRVAIGCIWLISFGISCLMLDKTIVNSLGLCLIILSLIFVTFLNVSILCILGRPGPGKPGGNKDRQDHSKQRALYTITSILGVLFLRFGWMLVWIIYEMIMEKNECIFFIYGIWVDFPSNLVLPLLFLQRTDTQKFYLCCKKKTPEG